MAKNNVQRDRQANVSANPLLDPNLQIIFGMTVMAIVGAFSIAPALPRMVAELGISQAEIGLLITIFTFPGIFLMPLIGVCADRFGRRNVVAVALFLFAVSGGACFFASDFHVLLALRFIQGIGAAPLSSLNIAIISDMFSGQTRVRAMGYNQAVLSIGAAVFTAAGGALATLGWHYPFLLPLLGIPIGMLILFKLKCPEPETTPVLSAYLRQAWQTLQTKQIIANYLITILALIVVWGSYISYFPILMGLKLKSPPYIIGLVMTSMTIMSALASSQMGRLSHYIKGKDLFKLCFLLYGIALVMMPHIMNPWILIVPVSIFGIAQGILIPNIQNYLGRFSSFENRGMVMSVYGSSIRIGQTLGPLLMGFVFSFSGINGVFFVCAGLAFLLIIFIMLMID